MVRSKIITSLGLTTLLAVATLLPRNVFAADAATAIVVCPDSWQPAMQNWVRYRGGQAVQVDFLSSAYSANQLRASILTRVDAATSPVTAVLLCGDAPTISEQTVTNDATSVNEFEPLTVPTFYVAAKVTHNFGGEPIIATDLPYCDFDADGLPDASLGRIPADTPEQLADYLARVIAYETDPQFIDWQSKVEVTAGVGGFGGIADRAIEMVTRQFLTSGIPNEFDVNMTYASPTSVYCPPPSELCETVLRNLNRGSLFWVYIGHGYIDTLDNMRVGNETINILNSSNLPDVAVKSGAPIAVFLACYTGAFDARKDALTEELLFRPRGPVGILAGSRVTMPYGMSVIATGMLDECFAKKTGSLGEVVLKAKRAAMVELQPDSNEATQRSTLDLIATAMSPAGHDMAAERAEHLALLNLLGDPLLSIPHPEPIEINVADRHESGQTLTIEGTCPIDGPLEITLGQRRDRSPVESQERAALPLTIESSAEIKRIYDAANSLVLERFVIAAVDGHFRLEIPTSAEQSGRFVITARQTDGDRWAAGSAEVIARKKRRSRGQSTPVNK